MGKGVFRERKITPYVHQAYTHTHLICGDVGHRQLGLIIQHLLKVGHVPRWVCRVPVKTLRQEDRSQGFMQFYVLGVAHASLLVWQSLEITWATWSWIPPKAIIRRVWRVICSASAPSEEARFTDQYDIKNIKFTAIQKEYHRECNCNQYSSEKHHSWVVQTHDICISKPRSSTAALGFCISDPSGVRLPGVGNLGASLNPPYSSSYKRDSCWKHLWATSRAEGRVSSEWAEMAVAFRSASITRSPLDSSASLLFCHWIGYEHWEVRQEIIHNTHLTCHGYVY